MKIKKQTVCLTYVICKKMITINQHTTLFANIHSSLYTVHGSTGLWTFLATVSLHDLQIWAINVK